MELCPGTSAAMMNSVTETYIIATNIDVESRRETYLASSQCWGDASLSLEQQLPWLIVIGTDGLNRGIDYVTIAIAHEVLGHVLEGKAGATQLEEFFAWKHGMAIATMLGVDDFINPWGDTDDFYEWRKNVELDILCDYRGLPLEEQTGIQYQAALHGHSAHIYAYLSEFEDYFGDWYIYGEYGSWDDWYDWYYYYYYYYY